MTDRSISIKADPKQKQFAGAVIGSLAQRVLLMSVALLGLPLLIHTIFLYHREYRENVDDAFVTLRSLSEGRALFFEEIIQNQKIILRSVLDKFPSDAQAQKEFLRNQAKEYQVDELFFVDFDENQKPHCDDLLCRDGTFFPLLQQEVPQETFVLINPHGQEKNEWMYVARMLDSKNPKAGALVIATPMDYILRNLLSQEYRPYPLRISLIDASGNIFLSSPSGLEGLSVVKSTKSIRWQAASKQQNSWIIQSPKGVFFASKSNIAKTQYSLMLDVPEQSIVNLQIQDYFFRLASLLFFICVIGGGLLIWLTHRLSKPLRALTNMMKRISEGSVHVRYVKDRMGFEINVLGQQMNQMLDAMVAHQQEALRERIARERLAEELKIGHRIQASMLPTNFFQATTLDIAPGYLSAREVSGDFYDMMVLDDGRIFFAIADAADKGISACLYSLSFRSILRASVAVMKDLASMIRVSNALLMQDTAASSFFITSWMGIYDPKTKELTYCSQGHPPAYVRKENGEVIELHAKGMALGIEPVEPQIQRYVLAKHDLLLLYTDGVIEAIDADNQFFGKERLKEFLSRTKKNQSQMIVDQLLDEIHLFSAGTLQVDDLTLLLIRIKN